MTRYTKRIYHDRQPRVGDRIEIANVSRWSELISGMELTVTSTQIPSGRGVVARNDRREGVEIVYDDEYRIYTDVTYEKTGEKHIVKKFLGIPFYRKVVEIFEEVGGA